MKSYQRFEGWFQSFDSTKIYYQGWETQKPKLSIFFTHGQGEHSDCYHRVIEHFKGHGINFYGWDMRGHGRSEGLRGYANQFQDYISDYQIFLDTLLKRAPSQKPVMLLAHSMGGLVQLSGLLERSQENFLGQILSAPLLGVAVNVPPVKKHGAELLSKFLPKLTLGNEVKNEMLTRDPDIMREFDKDTLRHGRISSGVYLGFLKQFEVVNARAGEMKLPTLFVCPEKDPVVDTQATLQFENQMGAENKKIILYGQEAKHEMFNDLHRQDVYKDVESFIDSLLKEKT